MSTKVEGTRKVRGRKREGKGKVRWSGDSGSSFDEDRPRVATGLDGLSKSSSSFSPGDVVSFSFDWWLMGGV